MKLPQRIHNLLRIILFAAVLFSSACRGNSPDEGLGLRR